MQLSSKNCEAPTNLRLALNSLSAMSKTGDFTREVGEVLSVQGGRISTTLANAFLGERCSIVSKDGLRTTDAQVVAVENGLAILSALEASAGISASSTVQGSGEAFCLTMGDHMIGRVIDACGRPLDGRQMTHENTTQMPVASAAASSLDRPVIDTVMETGIKTIDGFLTIGAGQRMAIFGEAGAGKSTLLSMLARHCEADVIILAMIGERGREVNEFLQRQIPPEIRARCVVVAATSERPAMERIQAAHASVAVAEYFRSKGKRVALLFDSVTRFARALREVGLAAGEQPVRSGFTPSVYAELPKLIERTGRTRDGVITAFFTVLTENEGVNDPIAEEVASLTDGHIMLDAKLARSGIYPAINILRSKSRLMGELADENHLEDANMLRRLIDKYDDMELLVQVGEYEPGTDPLADRAIASREPIRQFMMQQAKMAVPFNDMRDHMSAIVNG